MCCCSVFFALKFVCRNAHCTCIVCNINKHLIAAAVTTFITVSCCCFSPLPVSTRRFLQIGISNIFQSSFSSFFSSLSLPSLSISHYCLPRHSNLSSTANNKYIWRKKRYSSRKNVLWCLFKLKIPIVDLASHRPKWKQAITDMQNLWVRCLLDKS